jgi:hypothetical protein
MTDQQTDCMDNFSYQNILGALAAVFVNQYTTRHILFTGDTNKILQESELQSVQGGA